MCADLMCAEHYKLLLPMPDNKPSSLQTSLFSLSALNRDSRHSIILSQCIPAVRLQAAPLLGCKNTKMHTHILAQSPVGLDGWPGALRTRTYTVRLPIWAQQAVLHVHVHLISFSQTINVLQKGQYKPQSLKSLCHIALVKRSRVTIPRFSKQKEFKMKNYIVFDTDE